MLTLIEMESHEYFHYGKPLSKIHEGITVNVIGILSDVSFHSGESVVLLVYVGFHLLYVILENSDVILQQGHTNLKVICRIIYSLK